MASPRKIEISAASAARREKFLARIAAGFSLNESLEYVGVTMSSYKKWRQRDPMFAAKMDVVRRKPEDRDAPWSGSHNDFAREFFGMEYAWHQQLIIDEMESMPLGNIVLVLMPPEHGKTTTFENWASQKFALDKQFRLTIASENIGIAKKIAGRLKNRMEPDGPYPKYVARFGPFKPQQGQSRDMALAQPWGSAYFNVFGKASHDERDYSVQALGYGSSIVSTRCDHLHIDDLQSVKTLKPATTKSQITWFRQDALTRPGEYGRTSVVGTRVGEEDVYNEMMMQEELGDILKVIRLKAVMTDQLTGKQTALWPEKYSLDQLDRMRRKVGQEAWDRNYMQEPGISDKNRTFSDEALERSLDPGRSFFDPITRNTIVYIGLDPALGGRNCVLAAEITPSNRMVVRRIKEVTNLKANEQIMAEMNAVIAPIVLGGALVPDVVIETMNFQKGLANDERLEEMRRHYGFAVRPHLTGNNKYDEDIGVASMVTSFLKGEIIIPYSTEPASKALADELIRQLKAWRPGQRGKTLRQDQVMALWFVWILWRQRWKQAPTEDDSNTTAWKRAGLPWGQTKTGLVVPMGAR